MLIATDEIICVPLRGIQQHKGEKTSLDFRLIDNPDYKPVLASNQRSVNGSMK
jgi:hypothetical protein